MTHIYISLNTSEFFVHKFFVFYLGNPPPEIAKNPSKKMANLSRILPYFLVRPPVGENQYAGGSTLIVAAPVIATVPS